MKKISIIFSIILFGSIVATAQIPMKKQAISKIAPSRTTVSAGFGLVGNSVFGVELETLVLPHWGGVIGAGTNSFGIGINYHLSPTPRSPYILLDLFQHGYATEYQAAYLGSGFIYRTSKWLQVGAGLAYRIHDSGKVNYPTKVQFKFNLAIYLPL